MKPEAVADCRRAQPQMDLESPGDEIRQPELEMRPAEKESAVRDSRGVESVPGTRRLSRDSRK